MVGWALDVLGRQTECLMLEQMLTMRKREKLKNKSKIFGLSNWKDRVAIY